VQETNRQIIAVKSYNENVYSKGQISLARPKIPVIILRLGTNDMGFLIQFGEIVRWQSAKTVKTRRA
jgi:hypothetical protein